MAEETTVFKLEFDIPDAEKRADRVAERRPSGITPRIARDPRPLQTATEARRTRPGESGSRFQRARDRAQGIAGRLNLQAVGGLVERAGAAAITTVGIPVAAVGGGAVVALAVQAFRAKIFAAREVEKIQALARVLPIPGIEAAAELATAGAIPIKAFLQTANDVTTLIKALGAIGETPGGLDVGATVSALFKVNAARARLRLDASNALWDNRVSAAKEAARSALGSTPGAKNIAEAQAQAIETVESFKNTKRG